MIIANVPKPGEEPIPVNTNMVRVDRDQLEELQSDLRNCFDSLDICTDLAEGGVISKNKAIAIICLVRKELARIDVALTKMETRHD